MPTTTTLLGLPKPLLSESPNGPAQIGALADKLESGIATKFTTASQSTSSATPVALTTVDEVTLTTHANFLPISVHVFLSLTPSATGEARVNLFADGVDYGTILTAAANSGAQQRIATPNSSTGILVPASGVIGGWLVVAGMSAGSHTIALRYSSVSGSASFAGRLLVARVC